MARTTLQDFGRRSKEFGLIPYFYAFPYKFWFEEHQVSPDDVATWCLLNCQGYYKIVCYTHESSVRDPDDPRTYATKVIYVDKAYFQNEVDAVALCQAFSVRDVKVMRPHRAARYDKNADYSKKDQPPVDDPSLIEQAA